MINMSSHSRLGNISFIALVTTSYFFPRSLRSLVTKYDIIPRPIKLISCLAPHVITYHDESYNLSVIPCKNNFRAKVDVMSFVRVNIIRVK